MLASCWLLFVGCNLEGAGDPPPRGSFYLPTGVALSADGRFLFVLNSNFDRRYSAGTIQSYDLTELEEQGCANGGSPGLDCQKDPADALVSEVRVGSIGRTLVASPAGDRLYVPTHADGALTYVDVNEDGELSCGGDTDCSDDYRRGDDDSSTAHGARFPADPIAVWPAPRSSLTCADDDCPEDGEVVLVAHRGGAVSLFVDVEDDDGRLRLRLTDVLSSPFSGLTGLTQDPASGLFLLTNASNDTGSPKGLVRVGVYLGSDPADSFLYAASYVPLRGVSVGRNTWAVQSSQGTDGAEVDATADLLVVSQNPDALLRVAYQSATGEATVRYATEVGPGASRMALGTLTDGTQSQPLAAISCYSDRRLYVVDTQRGDVLSIVNGFNGPFEVAMDSTRNHAYVVDFRTSVLRIVDLAPVLSREPARIVATVGSPRHLEELQ